MTPIYGHDAEIAHWVGQRLGGEYWNDMARAIGLADDGKIICGVVYSNYRHPQNIEVSIASDSPKWATRKTLRMFFSYPFIQLNLPRITSITRAGADSVRHFNERLGFIEEGVLRHGFPDDDAVVYGLLKSECRWIR